MEEEFLISMEYIKKYGIEQMCFLIPLLQNLHGSNLSSTDMEEVFIYLPIRVLDSISLLLASLKLEDEKIKTAVKHCLNDWQNGVKKIANPSSALISLKDLEYILQVYEDQLEEETKKSIKHLLSQNDSLKKDQEYKMELIQAFGKSYARLGKIYYEKNYVLPYTLHQK